MGSGSPKDAPGLGRRANGLDPGEANFGQKGYRLHQSARIGQHAVAGAHVSAHNLSYRSPPVARQTGDYLHEVHGKLSLEDTSSASRCRCGTIATIARPEPKRVC